VLLSILIPTYNEAKTIVNLLDRVVAVRLPGDVSKEIIIIDDGSDDDTKERISDYISNHSPININYKKLDQNRGKGAAIREGIKLVNGDFILFQDADLEYNPVDYPILLSPLLNAQADVVYGSRFKQSSPIKTNIFYLGNMILTGFLNLFTGFKLTDMETCYKILHKDVLDKLDLKENGFGLEPEITCKLSKIKNIRLVEVPISYAARGYDEGKKIKFKDGIRAVYCIVKYSCLTSRVSPKTSGLFISNKLQNKKISCKDNLKK
jgi:glycosyltransferase involved in cell wall biosynthesis